MVCALEDEGFEIRDMINWLYFSGFPKSMDISKQIDKMKGVEREVLGESNAQVGVGWAESGNAGYKPNFNITKPATEEAQYWEGWGTALKPAQEPAILCRKPIEKGLNVSENVLKWGTGAINIDACRFGYGDPCWVGPQDEVENMVGKCRGNIGHKLSEKNKIHNTPPSDLGRWPANIYQCQIGRAHV